MSGTEAETVGEVPSSKTDPLVGLLIGGRFRMEAPIASGGMGVVYRAVQEPLGRKVAVKVLRQPSTPELDESHSQRFLQEAAVVSHLSHPNTIVVHDYGKEGALLYFVMEFIEGETLTERLRRTREPLTPEQAVHVADQIASSLADAHQNHLIHRDLKPGNIMLLERGGDPDFVKVLDFGLVKMVTEPSDADGGRQRQLTQSGILMGSPRYMSPEQVGGKDLDHRADIYSFGALLCFALTGQPPFHAGSQFEAMRAHVYTEAPRLRELHPECAASERLEALVLGCLQKDPNARPQTMVAIREELRACALAPRAADQGDARPTLGRGVPVQEGSSSSLFSQAIVNPGSSKVAWGIRFAVIALFLVAGAGLALLIPRPTAEPIATPLGSVTAEAATAEAVEPATPEPATPEPARITIDVSSVPVGARIVRMDPGRGDRVLGAAPVSLNLATTDRVALSISAPGYLAQTVYVDTSQPVVEVRLTEAPTEMPVSGDRPTMRPSLQADGDPTPAEREAREATDVPMVDNNGPIRDPWR